MQLSHNKKNRRLYPDMTQQQKKVSISSVSILHNPHQLTETFSTMAVDQPFKYDVPLIGTAPPVHDFNQPIPTPSIPASVNIDIFFFRQQISHFFPNLGFRYIFFF